MKAPKNYYNVVDQQKLGLDQIDKNKAAIAELQNLPVLPEVTDLDNGKLLVVRNGDWSVSDGISTCTVLVRNTNTITSVKAPKIVFTPSSINYFGVNITSSQLRAQSPARCLPIEYDDGLKLYVGIISSFTQGSSASNMILEGVVSDGIGIFKFTYSNEAPSISPIISTIIDVTISGSSVTLPTGYDYAAIKALVDAGVDVKLNDGSNIYFVNDNAARSVTFVSTITSTSFIRARKITIDDQDNYSFLSTDIRKVMYVPITISGSSASLQPDTTYAYIYARLNDGVEVKLTNGADVYTINDYDNVDLKAYTFDMGLTELYAKEIQLHSDGTGSYTMMTLTGTT